MIALYSSALLTALSALAVLIVWRLAPTQDAANYALLAYTLGLVVGFIAALMP